MEVARRSRARWQAPMIATPGEASDKSGSYAELYRYIPSSSTYRNNPAAARCSPGIRRMSTRQPGCSASRPEEMLVILGHERAFGPTRHAVETKELLEPEPSAVMRLVPDLSDRLLVASSFATDFVALLLPDRIEVVVEGRRQLEDRSHGVLLHLDSHSGAVRDPWPPAPLPLSASNRDRSLEHGLRIRSRPAALPHPSRVASGSRSDRRLRQTGRFHRR